MNIEVRRKQEYAEAIQYFSQKGFSRLLDGMVEKYRSLGHWGGSVKLTGLKDEEREALGSFFRRDFSRQKSVTLSLEQFAKALEQTRFSEIPPLDLLEAIKGEPILSKSEEYTQKEEAKRDYFQRLLGLYPKKYCQVWLKAILEKQPGTRTVHLTYERDPESLKVQMEHLLKALQVLQKREANQEGIERLPFFARRITKDPHGFDPTSETGRLLLHALRFLKRHLLLQNEEDPLLFSEELSEAEVLTQLYYSFGLLRDDLWNFVTCTGIIASAQSLKGSSTAIAPDEKGAQEVEEAEIGKEEIAPEQSRMGYLERAYQERVTLNLPLREIVKFGSVSPGNPSMDRVYVVENSGVFSALLDLFEEYYREKVLEDFLNPPLICTHGQFKLSSLLLFDKLAANGTKIYYSGDFDPEGLQMLERLKQRYPDLLVPWHYGLEDYHACISNQVHSPTRLKKLDKIQSQELVPLKEELKRTQCAGYQEGLLDMLWEDIRMNI